jgi:hypothetical protein
MNRGAPDRLDLAPQPQDLRGVAPPFSRTAADCG